MKTPSGIWDSNEFGFQMEESLPGIGGWDQKNLSTDSTRCRSCSKRCALSMMKRKRNEHVVSSKLLVSAAGLQDWWSACDGDVPAVGRTSLPDVDSSGSLKHEDA